MRRKRLEELGRLLVQRRAERPLALGDLEVRELLRARQEAVNQLGRPDVVQRVPEEHRPVDGQPLNER